MKDFGHVPQYDSGHVVVPQALLEHALGVLLGLAPVSDRLPMDIVDDYDLAVAQLRAAISQCEQ